MKKKIMVKGFKEELANISEAIQNYFGLEDNKAKEETTQKQKEEILAKKTIVKRNQHANNNAKETTKNNLETELQFIAILKKFNEALINKDIELLNINNLSTEAKTQATKDFIELSAKREEKLALAEAKKKIALQNKLNKFKEFLEVDLTDEEEEFILKNI